MALSESALDVELALEVGIGPRLGTNPRCESYIYANGIDATHKKKTQYTMCTALANTPNNCAIRTIFFGVVSIAQLVEVTDSAVLGSVAEVVSSNPRWVIKYFSAFTGIVVYYISPYQFSL